MIWQNVYIYIWRIILYHCSTNSVRSVTALMLEKSSWVNDDDDDDDNHSWWFRTREATWCSCEKTNCLSLALILGKCPSEEPDWIQAIYDSLLPLNTHNVEAPSFAAEVTQTENVLKRNTTHNYPQPTLFFFQAL